VIDPFSGGKDLNWVWRYAESQEQFLSLVARAIRDARDFNPDVTPQAIENVLMDEEFFFVPGLIQPQDKIIIGGPQKAYKTWLMLDLCRSLTMCTPFMGRDVWTPSSPVNILLIEEEGSFRSWAKRLSRLQIPEKLFLRHFHTWHREGFRFTDDPMVSKVISFIKQHDIEVVIFDPLQRMIPGIDENDNSETAIIWDQVMRMQNAVPTLTCIIAHHTGKNTEMGFEALRGASRHGGEVDVGIFIQKHPLEHGRFRCRIDGRDVQIELAPGEVFEGGISIEEDSFKIDAAEFKVTTKAAKVDANANAVLTALQGGAETRTEVMHASGLSDVTVRKYLAQYVEAGTVKEDKLGGGKPNVYRIT